MSIFSNFFKKEAPLLGLQGSGGGLGFLAGGSGGGVPSGEMVAATDFSSDGVDIMLQYRASCFTNFLCK